jgi:hypothetical protein
LAIDDSGSLDMLFAPGADGSMAAMLFENVTWSAKNGNGLVDVFFYASPVIVTGCSALFLLAGNIEALATLPQALATDAEFLGELSLIHLVLVFENEALEIILQ